MIIGRKSQLFTAIVLVSAAITSGCATKHAASTAEVRKPAAKAPAMEFGVARAHEQEGRLNEAHQLYVALYETNPNDAAVCHRLGIVKLKMGQNQDGITYLMEADSLKPGDATIKGDLGYAYIQDGDFSNAEKFLRASLNLDPKNTLTTNNLALAVGYQGRMSEAYGIYRGVVGDAEAHANLGYICSQLGKTEMAIQEYNRSLDLDPTYRPAAEALVQIAEIETQVASLSKPQKESGIQLTSGTK